MQASTALHKPFPLAIILKIILAIGLLAFGVVAFTGKTYWLYTPFIAFMVLLPFYNFKWFFWVFILSLPLSADVRFDSLALALPDEPMMIAMLLLLIMLLIHNRNAIPKWLWQNTITVIILIQLFWTIVAVFAAEQHVYSLKFLAAKLWFLAAFLFIPSLVIRAAIDFKRLFWFISVPVFLFSVFALSWHATTRFGYYESNVVVRPFFKNHVDYGAMLSMVFPSFFIVFLMLKGKPKLRKIVLGFILFLVVATYFSYSRAAIMAVMFALIVMQAVKMRKVNFILPTFYVFILSLIFVLAHNNKYIDFRPNKTHNVTQKTFVATVAGAFTGKDMSSMERFYRWIASVRMMQDRPWTGVGPGNWYFYYKPYAVTSFTTWVSRNPERSTTHNYFILMGSEQGFPALILYGILMVVLLAKAQKTYHRFEDQENKYFTLVVAMMIAASFVNNFFSELLETHKVGGLFYLAVALLIFLDSKSKKLVSIQGENQSEKA